MEVVLLNITLFGVRIKISKEYLVVAAIFLVLVFVYVGYRIHISGNDIVFETSANNGGLNVKVNGEKKEEDDNISIHIDGCVKNPGVVTIKRGEILQEAMTAAGGHTENADIKNINLAYKLNYNQKVTILSEGETIKVEGDNSAGEGAVITKDSGAAVVINDNVASNGLININSATVDMLQILPGIGPSTAEDIVIYRERQGAFKTIEDIMNVPGIKEGRFSNIKNLIKVD